VSPDPKLLENGRRVLHLEAEAVTATAQSLGPNFCEAVHRILATLAAGGKLIFSGVGKNTPIAQKLTATFNSIGAPSCFLDPVQAFHGDLGLCAEGDLAFLFSNSGQSEEVLRLLPMLRRFGVPVIGVTSRADSLLATTSDLALIYVVPAEACPLQVAPTSSTTATLALGDALAMTVMGELGLTRDDFAKFHPGGAIGRTLLLRARDLMRTGDRLAVARDSVLVRDAIVAMTRAKSGCLALTNDAGLLTGIFTDGDFRRKAATVDDLLSRPVSEHMTRNPVVIPEDALVVDAARIFQERKIDDLIIVDASNRPVGLIDIQDLPKVKVF
jgi:arabinose-5-phosphate isomerase